VEPRMIGSPCAFDPFPTVPISLGAPTIWEWSLKTILSKEPQ
jgi:hypothetical protein